MRDLARRAWHPLRRGHSNFLQLESRAIGAYPGGSGYAAGPRGVEGGVGAVASVRRHVFALFAGVSEAEKRLELAASEREKLTRALYEERQQV